MRTVALVLVAACGANSPEPDEGPRAVRTKEHLEAARKHDEVARERTSWPTTSAVTPGDATSGTTIPWNRTWDPDDEHGRLARIHRSEAAALEVGYIEACGSRDIKKLVGSPLTRHRVGGWNTAGGVVVLLSTHAGSAATLLSDLRCHRAWLLVGTGVEQGSPLALPGLLVEAKGDQDGITLTLSIKDKKLVPELQRRVLRQLEETTRRPPRQED
ncbi:MAG: hypothetical protein H0V17_21595 [Deltaproteobacteria bacterium]|nr:hypothetical protein [Deltaproteobacteria bacterium]